MELILATQKQLSYQQKLHYFTRPAHIEILVPVKRSRDVNAEVKS